MPMQRPKDMVYWYDECPPLFKLLFLGLQQIVVISVSLVIITIVLKSAQVEEKTILSTLSWAMIAMGITTLLQVIWKGPIGSGTLAPPVISAIYLQSSLHALALGGLPALMTMTIFAGLVEMLFSFFQRFLRGIFNPAFIGLIVLTVGFLLGSEGYKKAFAVGETQSPLFFYHCLNAVITLGVIIAMSVWGRGVLRLMGTLIGVVVGFLTAIFFGLIGEGAAKTLGELPFLALPSLPPFKVNFLPLMILPFAICAVTASLRVIGTVISSQQINDAAWKKPYFPSIRKGILADGIGLLLAGFCGSVGLSASPSSVGISKITGATSRYIAFAVAGFLLIFALIPKIVALFLMMPMSVAGAALMINGSFMIIAGIKIITSRLLDTRVTYIIGISMIVGLSRMIVPDFYQNLPHFLSYFTDSTLTLTTLTALILSLCFRLGTRRKTRLKKGVSSANFRAYLLDHTREWEEIPEATLDHAVEVVENILSQLECIEVSLDKVHFEVTYDHVDLTVFLSYPGFLISLDSPDDERRYFLEEDAFAAGLSRLIQGTLPDHYDFSTKDGLCSMVLKFYT